MKIDFNPFEWHHGYLGLALLIPGILFENIYILIIGLIIIVDELAQIFLLGQKSSPLHELYQFLYRRSRLVRRINSFFDRLFGKK